MTVISLSHGWKNKCLTLENNIHQFLIRTSIASVTNTVCKEFPTSLGNSGPQELDERKFRTNSARRRPVTSTNSLWFNNISHFFLGGFTGLYCLRRSVISLISSWAWTKSLCGQSNNAGNAQRDPIKVTLPYVRKADQETKLTRKKMDFPSSFFVTFLIVAMWNRNRDSINGENHSIILLSTKTRLPLHILSYISFLLVTSNFWTSLVLSLSRIVVPWAQSSWAFKRIRVPFDVHGVSFQQPCVNLFEFSILGGSRFWGYLSKHEFYEHHCCSCLDLME